MTSTYYATVATPDGDDVTEPDADTQLANFQQWLKPAHPTQASLEVVNGTLERPFAIYEPNPHHNSYGLTWSSTSERVTACANLAVNRLISEWNTLPPAAKDTHPNFRGWFHQGGGFDTTGWQFWEWLGHNAELAYFICELLIEWLPLRTAELLDKGTHADLT